MFERMLNKLALPTTEEMTAYCAENAEYFSLINEWLTNTYGTEQKTVFPYGNKYGWGIGHYIKKKHICNIFPEAGAFTVMMRLTNAQCEAVYGELKYGRDFIDNKYPCGDGGWIHYRVVCREHYEEVLKLLREKCRA